ncbi:uncharacterized protein LOC119682895 [Teleopsis dalmanni]|uniref:uncharacterized protein LOC119682895 n=1 Tax=Teleopsis dalmanni TaxID=139649 RepID=UPI0018CD4B1A|nr:uncharacterized protein LOC119682895 [Teleopsis dalmanni]
MAQKPIRPLNILKSIYYNEFQWSVVKSYALFFLGIRIANEFIGMEIMPPITTH